MISYCQRIKGSKKNGFKCQACSHCKDEKERESLELNSTSGGHSDNDPQKDLHTVVKEENKAESDGMSKSRKKEEGVWVRVAQYSAS